MQGGVFEHDVTAGHMVRGGWERVLYFKHLPTVSASAATCHIQTRCNIRLSAA